MARKIRIAVGSPDELHSSVWSIWTQGDDLYAAQRNAQGTMKVSVHKSGLCLNAFTSESGIKGGRSDDTRVQDRWNIPAVGEQAWVMCLQLVVPSIFIPERFTSSDIPPSRRSSIVWLSPAFLGQARVVTVARAESAQADIAEFLTGDYAVLEKLALRSGAVAWVLTWNEVMAPAPGETWQQLVGDFKLDVRGDLDGVKMLSMTSGSTQSEWPVIRDLALGRSNLRWLGPR